MGIQIQAYSCSGVEDSFYYKFLNMKSIILLSALMAMASAAPEADADPGHLYNSYFHYHRYPFHFRGYSYGLHPAIHRHPHLAGPYSFYGYPNGLASAFYGPRLYRRSADSESNAAPVAEAEAEAEAQAEASAIISAFLITAIITVTSTLTTGTTPQLKELVRIMGTMPYITGLMLTHSVTYSITIPHMHTHDTIQLSYIRSLIFNN